MASLLTMFVARGCEVPAVDLRIKAHIEALVVDTVDETQAPLAMAELEVLAPDESQASVTSTSAPQ